MSHTIEVIESASEAADLAWGAGEIAALIGRDERATYHLLSKGELPARKVGGQWVASRRRLLAFLRSEEDA